MKAPNVGLILLAAGASTRMGKPKQLLIYRGRSLLRCMAEEAIASHCHPIVVVLGSKADQIKLEVDDLDLQVVNNTNWTKGIGTSICTGMTELISINSFSKAVVITLCDQPFVTSNIIDQLISCYHTTHYPIIASAYASSLGVPALFNHTLFKELFKLDITAGAKHLIQQHLDQVHQVPFPEGAIDLDTPEDYQLIVKQTEL